ncbi:hypothetical protein BGX21_005994 [Mortierella sp. AD011]|nr:hypothetical protein BGX20_000071 [Mortierella sp. AD010]KAF9399561.1 hypothetical protein BGX21_005994 [Mortierella sp. AD011]
MDWILVVRFLVPSPTVESALPSYDPSPIPVPAVLHSPSRPNAVPASPAIRLHAPTTAATAAASPKVAKGARFADDSEDEPSSGTPTVARQANNVTFQARPGAGFSENSSGSIPTYPTFADYRQSQHGNLDAFAQRIKRAFATSQQQQQEQELRRQQKLEEERQIQEMGMVGLDMKPLDAESKSVKSLSDSVKPDINDNSNNNNNRRLSTSSANIFSDLADRIRSGFNRPQSNFQTRSSTDVQGEAHDNNNHTQDSQAQQSGINATDSA